MPPPLSQCYTVRSLGTAMGPNVLWPRQPIVDRGFDPPYEFVSYVPYVGDANGDGKADIIAFDQTRGWVWVLIAR